MLKRISTILACTILLTPLAALASSGHEHAPTFTSILPNWLNFTIFVGVFWWLVRGPFRRAWDLRREKIASAIHAGDLKLREAREELQDAQEKMARVESESTALSARIKRETEQEASRLLEESKRRAKDIGAQARQLMEAEKRAGEESLRRTVADQIIERAKERLSREIGEQNDRGLRSSALRGISGIVH